MTLEIEAKIRVDDHEPLRRVLESLGAVCAGKVLERNRIYDAPDHSLRRRGCGLRVRGVQVLEGPARSATLTYKGPLQPGPLKVRPEIELEVSSDEQAGRLLEALGYQVQVGFQKIRESWGLDECIIALDELPLAGRFVEIEGPSREAVQGMLQRLGLDDRPIIAETYMTLLARLHRSAGLDIRNITF